MARRKQNPAHPTHLTRICHRPAVDIVRQKREAKSSFRIKKEFKDANGKKKTINSDEIVEIPPEFRLMASDVSFDTRVYILNQIGGELSLNALALKSIEMTRSKEAADWWNQFSFKHWPVNKAAISKWNTSLKRNGKIFTCGAHLLGRKLEGPKLHERGIFKSLQLEFEAQVRGILEHYKYVEIKKLTPTFVSKKLKELYDIRTHKTQVGIYLSRTSWLKYNTEKKCYEADDDFEFFVGDKEEAKIDKIEEIDLSEKPKRTKSKTSSKETVIVKTEDAKEDDIAEPMKVEIIPMNEIQGFQIVPIFQMVPILNPSMIQSSSGTSGFANLQIL